MEYLESSLINACLTQGKAYEVMAKVSPEDFGDTLKPAANAVTHLMDQGTEPDLLTVAEQMESWGYPQPLEMLRNSVEWTSGGNIESQCKQLKRASLSRKLKMVSIQISRLAQDEEPEAAYEQACNALMDLSAGDADESLKSMNQMLKDYIEDLERRFESEEPFDGIATGYTDLDSRWMGMKPQNLIILAGRPAMGKTTLGMNIVEHSIQHGGSWLVFSMEMSATELVSKMLSSSGRLSYSRLSAASLDGDDWPKLVTGQSLLKDRNLHVDERSALSVPDMRARSYEVKGKTGQLDGILVDYIQLMKGRGQNRENEIGNISRDLKALAKELGVPIIAISQLNRECEKRPNKRPILSDLRDSGSIEQDANIVTFVYRDEVYNEETDLKGVAEIITAKYRGGKIGTDCLSWLGHYQRFDNLEYRPDVEAIAEQQEEAKSPAKSRAF